MTVTFIPRSRPVAARQARRSRLSSTRSIRQTRHLPSFLLLSVGWAPFWSPDDKRLDAGTFPRTKLHLSMMSRPAKTLLTPQEGTDKVRTVMPSSARDSRNLLDDRQGSEFQRLMLWISRQGGKPLTRHRLGCRRIRSIGRSGSRSRRTKTDPSSHARRRPAKKQAARLPAGQISGLVS